MFGLETGFLSKQTAGLIRGILQKRYSIGNTTVPLFSSPLRSIRVWTLSQTRETKLSKNDWLWEAFVWVTATTAWRSLFILIL